MSVVYPAANGNWSTVANWLTSGGGAYGLLPQNGDDVYANGKAIVIDVSTNNLNSIQNTATTGVTAGGSFNFGTGASSVTLNATNINKGNGSIITDAHTSGTITINATSIYSVASNTNYNVYKTGTGTLIINGTIYGCDTNSSAGVGISNGTCTINGACIGNVNSNSYGLNQTGGTVVLNGYATGGIGAGAYGIYLNGANAQLYVYGNQTSKLGSSQASFYINAGTATFYNDITTETTTAGTGYVIESASTSTGIVNILGSVYFNGNPSAQSLINIASTCSITGNVTGGNITGKWAIIPGTNANIIVTGNIIAGTSEDAIYSTNAGITVDCVGIITGSATKKAINIPTSTGIIKAKGNVVFANGYFPISAWKIFVNPTGTQTWTFQDTNNNNRVFASNFAGQPPQTDVRYNVVYGQSGEYKGTAYIPAPQYTATGVLVDNTVGTYNPAIDVWKVLTSETFGVNSMGERFLNQASSDFVGDAVTSLEL